ncbi:MAG: efflux RND transporter periplasmic adaptor subunit [Phycisphaerales bacterium]|nr:efflux RND transporter periplasmic adaptor subunit [Phycisphaerales bacterium]
MTTNTTHTTIPAPSLRIGSRVVLPLIIVGGATAILAWSSWRAWAPLTVVRASAVVIRTASDGGMTSGTATSGGLPARTSQQRGPIVQAPGWIEPAPFPISASALTPGVVREVLVLEGDHVIAGQVVARLIDDSAKLALQRAEAELLVKDAELAGIADELTRKEQLVAIGGVSVGEVARLALRVQGAKAARAQVASARDESALALARTEVRTPAEGVVMARLVTTGSFVGMGPENAAVVQIFDPASLQVRTDVPLADAGRLAIGQTAEIQVDALPGQTIRGRVIRLVQQADIAKNTLQAKVLLENPPAGLVPDMLARVRIQLGSTSSGAAAAAGGAAGGGRTELAVPESVVAHLALTPDGMRAGTIRVVIDVRDGVGTIDERAVVAADQTGADGWTTVFEGLRPGDFVVLADSPPTHKGQTVRIGTDDIVVAPPAATPSPAAVSNGTKGEHDAHN